MTELNSNESVDSSGSFRLLMSYVFADRPLFIKALLLVVIATGLDVLGPILGKVFIDRFIMPDDYPLWPIVGIISAFIITTVLGTFLQYQQTLKFINIALKAVLDIRKRVFSHVLKLPMAFFDKARTGQLVSRITNDTESIKDIYVQFLANVLSNVILLIGILTAMAILNIQLMLIALLLLPIVGGLIFIYQHFSGKIVAKSRQLRSDINATISESIAGMSVIQATNQQQPKLAQFNEINQGYYQTRLQTIKIASFLLRPAINLLSIIILVGVVWVFGRQVVEGVAQIGVLYAYLNYLGRFTEPLAEITQRFSLYQQAMVAGDRVYKLLQEPALVQFPNHGAAIEHGKLTVRDLSFGYHQDQYVLKKININIQSGDFYAIVGHTGSGKSTLLSLLLNFYQPQHGKIFIDDHLLPSFDHDTLRNGIGFIAQEPFILSSTIYENIDMGRSLGQQAVEQAAREAHLDEVIQQMPDGYQTQLGEGGLRLSTGQRQQLIIARALAGSPKILLLDEATANVDSETEQVVQKALNRLRGKVTMIVVAHRLSTISHADNILVLDKGELVEQGNHRELMRLKSGVYRSMYELQRQERKLAQLQA
ncbi:ABC transporter ATP-binding protein [Celerinatantimonas diazotrophica]|uniref:ATP-binding cassette subfamily B protein/ATP-binding cassette subfamily C protein/ATP-binding cassette subfamily B multidrug efflux pump n=1 Tax=Celerinatantimonas diazotrophica TaxID=412034 RepID=A0A4R1JAE2_9GAMM|nr:ABC transporter transmembrane domain-containing protein [Celerinatantimonas diazotrophica]TCK47602.1 ATP-binding cassette subfamily B protein/ATP-binding cassette subfamily C protein/ATP-binding cassette subfamily B multidrug efflux pump [Celerinatantimonas diazotrophica]CAG9296775.1 Multidrug resistance-like ATP-binding protein MdlB [Celerinatantimonas diazotrophica]